MESLLIALAALFVGIAAVPLLRQRRRALAALDGFIVVAIAGVVMVHLLPFSLVEAGWSAVAAALVGLLLPGALERRQGIDAGHGPDASRRGRRLPWVFLLAAAGLGTHAFLDGAALGSAGSEHAHEHAEALALAVILHRLPMGLVLGMLWAPRKRTPWIVGLWVAVATVGGYLLGHDALPALGRETLALFQALVAGSLLHVVFAHTPSELGHSTPETRFVGGLGAIAGLGVTVLLALDHPVAQHCVEELAALPALAELSLEVAPWLLAAFIGSGLLSAAFPSRDAHGLERGPAPLQAARGLVAGVPLPICACGILPVYRNLLARGVPGVGALAFLLATPGLGLDALLISWPLLGPEMTSLRIVGYAVFALVVALLLGRSMSVRATPSERVEELDGPATEVGPLSTRLAAGLRYGLSELCDHLLPWIFVGLLGAALLEPMVHDAGFVRWPPMLQVVAGALIGLPLYVEASGATPWVAVLLHKGLSPGAAIAFLLTGPALNRSTLGTLREQHGPARTIRFALVALVLAVVLGFAVDLLSPTLLPTGDGRRELHVESSHAHGPLAWFSLGALALLSLASLLRSGARGWLGQLRSRYGEHVHQDLDEHACAHDHGHAHAHTHVHGDHDHGDHDHAHEHDHDHDHDHAHEHDHGHDHASPSHAHAKHEHSH